MNISAAMPNMIILRCIIMGSLFFFFDKRGSETSDK